MEFMEGGTLTQAVNAYDFLEPQIAFVAREILHALEFIHNLGFVHRDLKSANVMMTINGEIKLIDFGLVIDLQYGTPEHMVGSPFWMPPEMIRRQPHGRAADIWSFAICLLELANKQPPNRSSFVRCMFMTATVGYPQPFENADMWSLDIKDFISHCLILEPELRWTASQLLEHPFLKAADTPDKMKRILSSIFIRNCLEFTGM